MDQILDLLAAVILELIELGRSGVSGRMDAIIIGFFTLVGTLAGVVAGGVIEGRRQKRAFERQRGWDLIRLQNDKLEAIAKLANEIYSGTVEFVGHIRNYAMVKADNFSEDAWREVYEQQKAMKSVPLAYLEMLVVFYAPELSGHMKALKKPWSELAEPLAIVMGQPSPEEATSAIQRAYDKISSADEACRSFVTAAGRLARSRLGIDGTEI